MKESIAFIVSVVFFGGRIMALEAVAPSLRFHKPLASQNIDTRPKEFSGIKGINDLLKNPSKISDFNERVRQHVTFAQQAKLSKEHVIALFENYPALGDRVISKLFDPSEKIHSQFEKAAQKVSEKEAEAYRNFYIANKNRVETQINHDAVLAKQLAESQNIQQAEQSSIILKNKCAFQAVDPNVKPVDIEAFVKDVQKNSEAYPLIFKEDIPAIRTNEFLEDRVLFSFAKFKGFGKVAVTDTTGKANKATGTNTYSYEIDPSNTTVLEVRYTQGHWAHIAGTAH
jgi:hypothetical protein